MSPGKQRQARKQILTDAGVLTQRVAGGQIERCTDVFRLAHNFWEGSVCVHSVQESSADMYPNTCSISLTSNNNEKKRWSASKFLQEVTELRFSCSLVLQHESPAWWRDPGNAKDKRNGGGTERRMHGTSLQKEADAVRRRGAACGEKVSLSLNEDGSVWVCVIGNCLWLFAWKSCSVLHYGATHREKERERATCEWERCVYACVCWHSVALRYPP